MTNLVKFIPETRDEFLMPFSNIFDRFMQSSFPDFSEIEIK